MLSVKSYSVLNCSVRSSRLLHYFDSRSPAKPGNDGRQVFVAAINRLNNQQQIETQEQLSKLNKSGSSASFTSATASEAGEKPAAEKKSREWSEDELQLLIKAVNLFPAGE